MLDKRLAQERENGIKVVRGISNRATDSKKLRSVVPIVLLLMIFASTIFLPLIFAGFEGSTKFWNASFTLNETGVWNITLDATAQWAYSVHTDVNRSINVTTPADVRMLEITDNGQAYSRMSLTPIEGATSNAAIRATIYDVDGIGGLNVTAYICDVSAYTSCSDTSYTYAKNLTYLEAAPSADEYYYIYNGTAGMPQFWKQAGTWKLYVKVIDGSSTDHNETDFSYATLMAVNISSVINLGGEAPTLGQWNSGTDKYTLTNWGNLNLSISWNASDMRSGEDSWTLNGTDFMIDDDNNYADDTSNLPFVYLTNAPKLFEPLSGLLVCSSDSCANENSTLNTYYHIAPPLGLKAGTYNTTIIITLSEK